MRILPFHVYKHDVYNGQTFKTLFHFIRQQNSANLSCTCLIKKRFRRLQVFDNYRYNNNERQRFAFVRLYLPIFTRIFCGIKNYL